MRKDSTPRGGFVLNSDVFVPAAVLIRSSHKSIVIKSRRARVEYFKRELKI